jgi:hypothetical protein
MDNDEIGRCGIIFPCIEFFVVSTKHSADTALLHARQEVKSDRSLDGDTVMEIVL